MQRVYGQSKIEKCPFCSKTAIAMNKQGVAVCLLHKNNSVDHKCVCGEILEIKQGKWGAFAVCRNCGAMNMKKAMGLR